MMKQSRNSVHSFYIKNSVNKMGYKGTNWTRGELGHEPPTKEEVASDMARDYKEDERNLEELREQLEEKKERKKKEKIRHDAKKEMAENIIEDLEGMKKEVENTVEHQPIDEAEAWGNVVRKYVMEMKGYTRPRHPEADKDLRKLQTLVMGGKIVEEDKEPEEVL